MNGPLETIPATTADRATFSSEDELTVLRARIEKLERESAERKWMDSALKALDFSTASVTGHEFLLQLVRQLSETLQVPYVFVTELIPGKTNWVRTVAGWSRDRAADPLEYALNAPPCQKVFQDGQVFIPQHVQQLFPEDTYLATLNLESYMGVSLRNGAGQTTGHLCVMDVRPFLFDSSQGTPIITAFAERAAAELERLRAEDTLRQNEERFRALYDDNPSMYFTLSATGTVLSVNTFGAKQLGYTELELVGRSVLAVFDPDDHRAVLDQLTLCAANPYQTFEWELQKIRKDGSRIWVRERARTVIDTTGQISLLIVCNDITAQHQTLEALRDNEARWRVIFEQSAVGMAQLGLTGQFLQANPALVDILGYSLEDLLRKSFQEVTHPDDLAVNLKLMEDLLSGAQDRFSLEKRCLRVDGTFVWVAFTVSLVRNHADSPAYFIAVVKNISARKQAEADLAATTQLLQTLVAESPLPIVSLDAHARVTSWNRAATRLFGWSEDEVLGRELPYVTKGQERSADALWEQGTRGKITGPIELRRHRKDGSMLDLLLWPVFVRNESEELSTAVGLFVDQSDLKRAEAALRARQARLDFVLSHSLAVIYTAAATGTYGATFVSANITAQLGYEPHEFTDDPRFWINRIHPEDAPAIMEGFSTLFSSGSLTHEYRFLNKQGQYRWMRDELILIRDPDGHPVELLGSWFDITERKYTEELLRVSEERFAKAFRSSPHPVIVTERDTGRCLEVNDAGLTLFGYRRDEVIGQTVLTLGLWPASGERDQFFAQLALKGTLRNIEVQLYTKDRTLRHCLVSCEPIELNGKACLVTVGTDITEQKQAEEALRLQERILQQSREERERISQDLHDNILQSLYAVGMQLEASKLVAGTSARKSKTHITQAIAQLNHLVLEVRHFIGLLHQRNASNMDFERALRQLINSFSSAGQTAPTLNIQPEVIPLIKADVGEQLLSIAREALSNSMRHAKASTRSITLRLIGPSIQLRVADDGIGFKTGRKRRRGHGLTNMATRARHIGARFLLTSEPGQGTNVTVEVPLERPYESGTI